MERTYYNRLIDSDTKKYEEIRKLATRLCEYCTTRCLLDFECIKNHYKQ